MVSGHLATLIERAHQAHRHGRRRRAEGHAQARPPSCTSFCPRCRRETLADEARRNLEILMLHDPAKNVDGVAIHMQIMNTTRAKTRSRDMGIGRAS